MRCYRDSRRWWKITQNSAGLELRHEKPLTFYVVSLRQACRCFFQVAHGGSSHASIFPRHVFPLEFLRFARILFSFPFFFTALRSSAGSSFKPSASASSRAEESLGREPANGAPDYVKALGGQTRFVSKPQLYMDRKIKVSLNIQHAVQINIFSKCIDVCWLFFSTDTQRRRRARCESPSSIGMDVAKNFTVGFFLLFRFSFLYLVEPLHCCCCCRLRS